MLFPIQSRFGAGQFQRVLRALGRRKVSAQGDEKVPSFKRQVGQLGPAQEEPKQARVSGRTAVCKRQF